MSKNKHKFRVVEVRKGKAGFKSRILSTHTTLGAARKARDKMPMYHVQCWDGAGWVRPDQLI